MGSWVKTNLGDANTDVSGVQIGKRGDLELIEHFDASDGRRGHDLQIVGDHISDVLPHKSLAGAGGTSGLPNV
jgi:hypothetical protein